MPLDQQLSRLTELTHALFTSVEQADWEQARRLEQQRLQLASDCIAQARTDSERERVRDGFMQIVDGSKALVADLEILRATATRELLSAKRGRAAQDAYATSQG